MKNKKLLPNLRRALFPMMICTLFIGCEKDPVNPTNPGNGNGNGTGNENNTTQFDTVFLPFYDYGNGHSDYTHIEPDTIQYYLNNPKNFIVMQAGGPTDDTLQYHGRSANQVEQIKNYFEQRINLAPTRVGMSGHAKFKRTAISQETQNYFTNHGLQIILVDNSKQH